MTRRPPTSTQPQPVDQRIYGSTKVEPLEGASNQPQVLPHTKVYGQRLNKTFCVKLKNSTNDREMIISADDFDPAKHEQLG